MGFSFRKRIKIAPGLNLNLSKSGLGISAGPKGAKVSFGADGKTRLNAGKGPLRYTKTLTHSSMNDQEHYQKFANRFTKTFTTCFTIIFGVSIVFMTVMVLWILLS